MKKMYLTLTITLVLGLTAHSALCMDNQKMLEEENRKTLLKLKKEFEEELEKNCKISLEQPISGYLITHSPPHFLEVNSVEISNQKLTRLALAIGELEKKLGIEKKIISYGKDPIPETQNETWGPFSKTKGPYWTEEDPEEK